MTQTIKHLACAYNSATIALEKNLINYEDYVKISDAVLTAMQVWNDNFNYELNTQLKKTERR